MATVVTEKSSTIPTASTGTTNGMTTKKVVTNLKQKKRRKKIIIFGLAGLVVLIVVLAIAGSGKERAVSVQTEKVTRRTITEVVQATGKIQPEVQVKVSPEVSGEIIELPVQEGQSVTRGQLIAKIKPTTFEAQHEQGVAMLNATRARVEQSRANMLTAKQDLNRAEGLRKQNLLSAAEYEAAQNRYQIAEASMNAAQFEVAASESQLKQITESLRKTAVFAPMTGVVTSLISRLGEKVVGTSQFSGTEMMTVSDLAVMNAEVEVDENDVVNVKLGNKAKLTIDAFPNRVFEGTVVEIANSAKLKGLGTQDQSTNFAVKIRLNDFQGADLRPGMSCTAKIETSTKENVIAVPMIAVTRRDVDTAKIDETLPEEQQQKLALEKEKKEIPLIVFVNDKGKAKAVKVKTGISDNAYVEITDGLKGDEEVVKGNFRAITKELEDKKAIKVENGGSATKAAK